MSSRSEIVARRRYWLREWEQWYRANAAGFKGFDGMGDSDASIVYSLAHNARLSAARFEDEACKSYHRAYPHRLTGETHVNYKRYWLASKRFEKAVEVNKRTIITAEPVVRAYDAWRAHRDAEKRLEEEAGALSPASAQAAPQPPDSVVLPPVEDVFGFDAQV